MKLPKLKVRRNTVVRHKEGTFYGRVIRMLPNGKAFWLCCGLHFRIDPVEDLLLENYKGNHSFYTNRWIPMTSLRRLKKRAIQFHGANAHNTPLDYEFIKHG